MADGAASESVPDSTAVMAFDSSVIIAALCAWHDQHAAAHKAVAALLGAGSPPVIPHHALIEAYAVLTRLPAGYRIAPADAEQLLRRAFHGRARIVASRGNVTWSLLRDAAEKRVAGGAIYDFRIVRAARSAGATHLLTLNARDFERHGLDGVEIITP